MRHPATCGRYHYPCWLFAKTISERIIFILRRLMADDDKEIRNLFGKNLKRLRNIANLSQIDLAEEADLAQNFITDIENGKKWVSNATISKLAKALKVEPYQFFRPEAKWDEERVEIPSLYLDDFSDSLAKIVKEYLYSYLPKKPEGTEKDKE